MVLAWCCWQEFCLCRSWFPGRILAVFSILSISQQIDVISKPQVAKRSSFDGHWRQWGVNFFCILHHRQVVLWCILWCIKAFCIVFAMNKFNKQYVNGNPCCTPTVVRKKSPTLPFINTMLVTSSCNNLMTSSSRLPLARGRHTGHNRTFFWSGWNCERVILIFRVLLRQC